MNNKPFSIKIGGAAGDGIKAAGNIISKLITRSGYFVHTYTEYPSLIRGGHNVMQILLSDQEVLSPFQHTDLLVALNQETIDLHFHELSDQAQIIFDSEKDLNFDQVSKPVKKIAIPLSKLANENGGSNLLSNTVSLGAIVAALSGDLDLLKNILIEEFSRKGNEITNANINCAQAGFNFVKTNLDQQTVKLIPPKENFQPQMVINGAEAIALGAIAGGLQFASIYPMSPISHIINVLADNQEKYLYIYKQPEDEIAAINMAIGASHAGARSMVATSGGGFSLMVEAYGLAAMLETPLVIIEGMRPGPATGLPTWQGQGDLQFILHAHQGDFPRIVISPSDIKDAFYQTRNAFNLAAKYQTPVVILVDKNILENSQSVIPFDNDQFEIDLGITHPDNDPNFQRYTITENGISPRSFPGKGNFFISNSYEHDEIGYDTENPQITINQQKKRHAKFLTIASQESINSSLFGPDFSDLTLVSWGSNKGPILEALKNFTNVNYLHLNWQSPFDVDFVKKVLSNAKYLLLIETNFSGQLGKLITQETGIEILDKYLKFDGRPIYPEEISQKINTILKH